MYRTLLVRGVAAGAIVASGLWLACATIPDFVVGSGEDARIEKDGAASTLDALVPIDGSTGDAGFAPEVLKDISAVELTIAWKAARFDEMEAKAKQAATAPRRNPVAPPTKPIKPAGSGDVSPQRTLQGLSQKLTNSGKLDDFVALMDAEQAQAASKAKRR